MSLEQFEERKQEILVMCQNAKKSGLAFDAPFDLRKRIIKTIVDKINLNANEGWFELKGVINGQYLFANNDNNPDAGSGEQGNNGGKIVPIVCNPKDRDSLQQSIESSQKMSVILLRG
jgi:hypothetical protein